MGELTIYEQLCFCTTRIETEDANGNTYSGSGFFFNLKVGDKTVPLLITLKSATKPFNVLIACTRPLITELSDKLRLKHPLLPTTSHYSIMRFETIRYIIPINYRRYPKSVWNTSA